MAYDYSRVRRAIGEARRICAQTRVLIEKRHPVTGEVSARHHGARLRRQGAIPLRKPTPFAVAGTIKSWEPVSRQITLGTQTFTASAEVSVIGLARHRHVLMSGELPAASSPHVVTRIILRRLAS